MSGVTPLGPRVSKEEFMRGLGLQANDLYHEQFYRAMRDEAVAVYTILNSDTSHLIESVQNSPETRPPFFWHHITPESQRWAIMEVWTRSGPTTRPFFDMGATSSEHGPNWVAGWLLYSVFRSRDIRNNRNRRKSQTTRHSSRATTEAPEESSSDHDHPVVFYDPVRENVKIISQK
ncbi:hypothetical protein KEM52_001009 [Ascosphaera acerosa]|nr:hypothetical protein KEM52_001009 [Ascosphaera acerosa]